MEKRRADRFNECAVLIQKNMRRYITRRDYLLMKDITMRLQQVARKNMGMRNLLLVRQERVVLLIQTHARGYLAKRRMDEQRNFLSRVQAGRMIGYCVLYMHDLTFVCYSMPWSFGSQSIWQL